MDSLYAQYIKELTEDQVIESDSGFATYRYLNDGKSVYIVDIYTAKHLRETGLAAKIADSIAAIAKEKGCTEMLGTVCPSRKGSTRSLSVLLAYGMTLHSAANDVVMLRKDI